MIYIYNGISFKPTVWDINDLFCLIAYQPSGVI